MIGRARVIGEAMDIVEPAARVVERKIIEGRNGVQRSWRGRTREQDSGGGGAGDGRLRRGAII